MNILGKLINGGFSVFFGFTVLLAFCRIYLELDERLSVGIVGAALVMLLFAAALALAYVLSRLEGGRKAFRR